LYVLTGAEGCSGTERTEVTARPPVRSTTGAAGSVAQPDAGSNKAKSDDASRPTVITGGQAAAGSASPKARENKDALRLELRFVCDGECSEVEAVASGGNPAYTFAWEDGTTTAKRRLCAADGGQQVTVTDTPIESAEFGYPGAAVTSTVTAAQLKCTDDEPETNEPETKEEEPAPPPGDFCVKNPSLEGGTFPGMPPDWTSCLNTPDIGPVGIGIPASDGTGYLGAAASGSPLAQETFEGALCNPFKGGETASFQVDLSMSTAWGNPGLGALEIWGASTSCATDEMLWASPKLENLDMWKTFCVTITPTKDVTSLVMVPAVAGNDPATAGQGGYVVLDNIRPVESCD
jgi:hypothetical protein